MVKTGLFALNFQAITFNRLTNLININSCHISGKWFTEQID